MYPNISYTGIDVSSKSIEFAKKKYNNHAFHLIDDFILRDHFDFVYTNGVFHHINHSEHLNCLKQIYSLLKAGGSLCFWENNPLNIGTRIVMSFNQFDNNAKLIYHWNIISKIRELKFNNINFFSHFYLPSFLQKLRIIEHSLRHLPFGGQYVIYATK
jgi:SAM-dependent methyltransferase